MKNGLLASTFVVASIAAPTLAGVGPTTTHETSFLGFGTEMPYGDGNMNTNFTVTSYNLGDGLNEIGLKAKERFVGDLTTDGAGRYYANAGSPGSDALSSWNIDYGFALANDLTAANYSLVLSVDFDAGFGSQSWVHLDITQTLANFFLTTSSGGDSQNPGFGFWSTSSTGPLALELDASGYIAFDAYSAGEYDVQLQLIDHSNNVTATSSIVVEVVPTPSSLALLGCSGLLATRRKR